MSEQPSHTDNLIQLVDVAICPENRKWVPNERRRASLVRRKVRQNRGIRKEIVEGEWVSMPRLMLVLKKELVSELY